MPVMIDETIRLSLFARCVTRAMLTAQAGKPLLPVRRVVAGLPSLCLA